MKLSEKGWRKAMVAGELLDDPDFEPDDFVDAVVLTVEEAKKILGFFDVVALCDYPFRLSDEEEMLWETLAERIEQAEMSKQST